MPTLTSAQRKVLTQLYIKYKNDKKMFPVVFYLFSLVPNFRIKTISFGMVLFFILFGTKPGYQLYSAHPVYDFIIWILMWALMFSVHGLLAFLIYSLHMMYQSIKILGNK